MPTFETRVHGLPPGLPYGKHQVKQGEITVAEDGSITVDLHYVPPEPPPEPEAEYLLVKVRSDSTFEATAHMHSLPSVLEVSVHGKGCCCKNCPWGGDHG